MIEVSGLTKKYGSQMAVDDLSLTIHKGEIFGLLGPNGAGKSTTIRMILGLTEPTGGTVKVCGYSSAMQPIKVKERVGYLPEDVGFYNHMTGFENLMYTARLNRIPPREGEERVGKLLELVGLTREATKKVGAYSRGMRQRLGLADVLVKQPEVVILDEPTLGLDPRGMKDFLQLITSLSKEHGLTVLFSSHHLHQVQHICDRVGIFVKGRLIAAGDIATLSSRLFAGCPVVVEAGLNIDASGGNGIAQKVGQLALALRQLEGVVDTNIRHDHLRIECETDVTPEVARVIATHEVGLVSLNKKVYGLDDIYNKYFEGGSDHA